MRFYGTSSDLTTWATEAEEATGKPVTLIKRTIFRRRPYVEVVGLSDEDRPAMVALMRSVDPNSNTTWETKVSWGR